MYAFLAAAMARSRGDTTIEENRTFNTYTGWTYAEAFGSNTVPPNSRLPCSLNISDLENPHQCYWCGESLPHKKET